MKWNEFDNTVFIDKVFTICPDIGFIDIYDLKIKTDAKVLILTFDLVDELPDNPPTKWGTNFNRCRMGINCGEIDKLQMTGWDYTIEAKLSIEKRSDLYYVDIKSEKLNLIFNCHYITVHNPSVYLSE